MAELNDINQSGDLTEIKLGGTADDDKVLSSIEVDAKDLETLNLAYTYTDGKVTGATGSFTAQSGETVTVVNGLITDIT